MPLDVKSKWKKSIYTSYVESDQGDIILHNSFMGSLARIPKNKVPEIMPFLTHGKKALYNENDLITEMCEQRFFVPDEENEIIEVNKIIEKERLSGYTIMILPTENCNFRCIYCYEKFKKGRIENWLILSLKKFVEKLAKDYKVINIAWFGGEPLLAYKEIIDLMTSFKISCEKYNTFISSGMSTNAYLLDENKIDNLLNKNISNFQICLDGPSDVHNKKRLLSNGKGTYDKILGNLLSFKKRNDDFLISIRVNFDTENIDLIEDWLLKELGPKLGNDKRFGMHFENVGKWGGPNDNSLQICDKQNSFKTKAHLYKLSLKLGFSDEGLKRYLIPHGVVCIAGKKNSIIFGSDGTLHKCSLALYDKRNILGKIDHNGKLNIDKSKLIKWSNVGSTEYCRKCHYYPCCQGRKCPLFELNNSEPKCPITKEFYGSIIDTVATSIPQGL